MEFNCPSWAQRSRISVSVEDASSLKSSTGETLWFLTINFLAVLNSELWDCPPTMSCWLVAIVGADSGESGHDDKYLAGVEKHQLESAHFHKVNGSPKEQGTRFSVKSGMFQPLICLFVTLWPCVSHSHISQSSIPSCVEWKGWFNPIRISNNDSIFIFYLKGQPSPSWISCSWFFLHSVFHKSYLCKQSQHPQSLPLLSASKPVFFFQNYDSHPRHQQSFHMQLQWPFSSPTFLKPFSNEHFESACNLCMCPGWVSNP